MFEACASSHCIPSISWLNDPFSTISSHQFDLISRIEVISYSFHVNFSSKVRLIGLNFHTFSWKFSNFEVVFSLVIFFILIFPTFAFGVSPCRYASMHFFSYFPILTDFEIEGYS